MKADGAMVALGVLGLRLSLSWSWTLLWETRLGGLFMAMQGLVSTEVHAPSAQEGRRPS